MALTAAAKGVEEARTRIYNIQKLKQVKGVGATLVAVRYGSRMLAELHSAPLWCKASELLRSPSAQPQNAQPQETQRHGTQKVYFGHRSHD
jgi:hypothetical protein